MKFRSSLLLTLAVVVMALILSGCQQRYEPISFSEVHSHPQAVAISYFSSDNPEVAQFPFPYPVVNGVISDGTYKGYKIEAFQAYSIEGRVNPTLESFFGTELGNTWDRQGDELIYDEAVGDITGQSWSRDDQVYLTYSFVDQDLTVLYTYLLFK